MKIEDYKFVSYNEETRPYISFILAKDNPWEKMIILLHSLNDLPDSSFLNGKVFTSVLNKVEIKGLGGFPLFLKNEKFSVLSCKKCIASIRKYPWNTTGLNH